MRAIASSVQHLIRENKNVAFVFAGITTGVLDMPNGRTLTFLRRAKAEELGSILLDEVAQALRHTIEKPGLAIDDEALDVKTAATAQDDGASSTAEVARRIGVKASSTTSYRRMLIKRQVIEATARGFVGFSIPHLREYLRDSSDELLARYGR